MSGGLCRRVYEGRVPCRTDLIGEAYAGRGLFGAGPYQLEADLPVLPVHLGVVVPHAGGAPAGSVSLVVLSRHANERQGVRQRVPEVAPVAGMGRPRGLGGVVFKQVEERLLGHAVQLLQLHFNFRVPGRGTSRAWRRGCGRGGLTPVPGSPGLTFPVYSALRNLRRCFPWGAVEDLEEPPAVMAFDLHPTVVVGGGKVGGAEGGRPKTPPEFEVLNCPTGHCREAFKNAAAVVESTAAGHLVNPGSIPDTPQLLQDGP